MFVFAKAFNQPLGSWNVTNARITEMFAGAESFDQDLSGWDVSSITDMGEIFTDSAISTANYNAILISWAAQAVQNNVVFSAGTTKYSAGAAAAARAVLVGKGWVITDGGEAP